MLNRDQFMRRRDLPPAPTNGQQEYSLDKHGNMHFVAPNGGPSGMYSVAEVDEYSRRAKEEPDADPELTDEWTGFQAQGSLFHHQDIAHRDYQVRRGILDENPDLLAIPVGRQTHAEADDKLDQVKDTLATRAMSISETRTLGHVLDNVEIGGTSSRNLGSWYPQSGTMTLKSAGSADTAAHEAGHAIHIPQGYGYSEFTPRGRRSAKNPDPVEEGVADGFSDRVNRRPSIHEKGEYYFQYENTMGNWSKADEATYLHAREATRRNGIPEYMSPMQMYREYPDIHVGDQARNPYNFRVNDPNEKIPHQQLVNEMGKISRDRATMNPKIGTQDRLPGVDWKKH